MSNQMDKKPDKPAALEVTNEELSRRISELSNRIELLLKLMNERSVDLEELRRKKSALLITA